MGSRAPLADYFREATAASAVEVAQSLWNSGVTPADFSEANDRYNSAIMEQYKLYVELADRVSVRRGIANTFFLTLNTAVFAAVGVAWESRPEAPPAVAAVPLAILVVQCFVWFWVIRSHRQLNSAKWAVVGAFEQRLPASPWWGAEWKALGEGERPDRYWPLTHVEQWVPVIFGAAYIAGFVGLLTL